MARKQHGYPGHFIACGNCCFHLHTSVPGYRISTVGCYHSDGDRSKPAEPVGYMRMYETYVFRTKGDNDVKSYSEIESIASDTPEEAEAAHEKLCQKYEKRKR